MSLPVASLLAAWLAAPGPVLVVPPEGGAAADTLRWAAAAAEDLLTSDLLRLGVPVVAQHERTHARESLSLAQGALTRATWIRVAETLDAARIAFVTASGGEALQLEVRLLDVERGAASAPLLATGPLADLPHLVRRLAWDVALAGPAPPRPTRDEFLARSAAHLPPTAVRSYGGGLAAADAGERGRLLRAALAEHGAFDEARIALGRHLLERKDATGAAAVLAGVPSPSPLSRPACFLRGLALLGLGRYAEAANVYASISAQGPSAAVLNNYGLALLRVPNAGTRASPALRKAVDLEPGSADIAFNLGWALLLEGEADAASFWLRGVAARDVQDSSARLALSWALRRAGRAAEADEEWKAATTLAPSLRELAALDARRRLERVLPAERLVALDPESRTDSETAAALMARAERQADAKDLDGALRTLTRAAYLDPHGPLVHRLLARVHLARGEVDKGEAELRMSLWCREDPSVRQELAAFLRARGRTAEAEAEEEKARRAQAAQP